MCACSHDFVCSKCQGTPFDPAYLDQEHEPPSWDDLIAESDAEARTPDRGSR